MGSPMAKRWKAQGDGPVATMEYGGRTRAGCAACRKKKLKCKQNDLLFNIHAKQFPSSCLFL